MKKTIIALTVTALGAADTYSATVDKLRVAVAKDGVDTTDHYAVSQSIIHGVGVKRGCKVRIRTNNVGAEVKNKQLVPTGCPQIEQTRIENWYPS